MCSIITYTKWISRCENFVQLFWYITSSCQCWLPWSWSFQSIVNAYTLNRLYFCPNFLMCYWPIIWLMQTTSWWWCFAFFAQESHGLRWWRLKGLITVSFQGIPSHIWSNRLRFVLNCYCLFSTIRLWYNMVSTFI